MLSTFSSKQETAVTPAATSPKLAGTIADVPSPVMQLRYASSPLQQSTPPLSCTDTSSPVMQLRYASSPLQHNGLPPALQHSMQAMSGLDLSDVQVHTNSSQPARYQAHAYAQGSQIHLAPGQEHHLPHEAWHVVQQKQGRVSADAQIAGAAVNHEPQLESEADQMGARALAGSAIQCAGLRKVGLANNSPMQRVIDGMAAYTNEAAIPPAWVTAYINDLTDQHMFLSAVDINTLYGQVIGGAPGDDGYEFINTNANHWEVRNLMTGQIYHTVPDGNCGIYAVDVVRRLLAGEVLNTDQEYDAPLLTVTNGRATVQAQAQVRRVADGGLDVREEIAATINRVDNVFQTGFGPQLRQLVMHQYILQDEARRRNLFEIGYASLYPNFKGFNFPKPSSALSSLGKGDFFGNKPSSLADLMKDGMESSYASSNSGPRLSLKDEVFQKQIRRAIEMALPHFSSYEEALAMLKGIKSQRKLNSTIRKLRLGGNRLLAEGQRDVLKPKLGSLLFLRKILRASDLARHRLVKKGGKMQGVVSGGVRDLRKTPLDNAGRFAAFEGFKELSGKSSQKKDLQFGLSGGGQSSFGSGGFQVKGLGTYPEEMIWFEAKLKQWACQPGDIFAAIQERDVDALMRLTGNNKADVAHLLRFEDLQVLERWRAGPFGLGVAASSRLGYHGQETFSGYMQNMPMREAGATTNVSETTDFDKPHDAKLWKLQEQQTLAALNRLMDLEVPQGSVFDQHSANFLAQLALEPEGGDPSEQLVEQSAFFMQSPLPFINDDESMPEDSAELDEEEHKDEHK